MISVVCFWQNIYISLLFYTSGENIRHKSWSLFPLPFINNKHLSVLSEMSSLHFNTSSLLLPWGHFLAKKLSFFYIRLRVQTVDNNCSQVLFCHSVAGASLLQRHHLKSHQALKPINLADLTVIHSKSHKSCSNAR